ncbi:MAG: holin, BlyA family protein [Lachnospiraceae bacterium]|nr:holin, BlyA family protein [Lachnospiraceae bacterium]
MFISFWEDESGVGIVEIILILVVLVALVLIFRTKITAIVKSAFASITENSGKITKSISI